MKRFLLLLATLVVISTSAFAQTNEFGQGSEVVKPRNDLAFAFGLPGILNLSYTKVFNRVPGIRLTGGGLFGDGHWLGGQAEFLFVLEHSQTFTADLSLGIGAIDVDSEEDNGGISYAGLFVNIRYRRFVTQLGTGTTLSNSGNLDDGGVFLFNLGIVLARFK